MIGYRIATKDRVDTWPDAFSGIGSFRYGGRWSSPGTRMVYASTHLSLAALEIIVHAKKKGFIEGRVVVRFEVDDNLAMHLDEDALPDSWDALPAPVSAQKSGDEWITTKDSMVLVVPTAVLPDGTTLEERNLLLNPEFPDFLQHIQNPTLVPFSFDNRIVDLVHEP